VASPASAAPTVGIGCDATGVHGEATWTFDGKTQLDNLKLTVKDTAGDGHHVGIRLVTVGPDSSVHEWPLHEEFGGKGATHTWSTTATLASGIAMVEVQAKTMEGSRTVSECGSEGVRNPAY
jgi:hypothetical protein